MEGTETRSKQTNRGTEELFYGEKYPNENQTQRCNGKDRWVVRPNVDWLRDSWLPLLPCMLLHSPLCRVTVPPLGHPMLEVLQASSSGDPPSLPQITSAPTEALTASITTSTQMTHTWLFPAPTFHLSLRPVYPAPYSTFPPGWLEP